MECHKNASRRARYKINVCKFNKKEDNLSNDTIKNVSVNRETEFSRAHGSFFNDFLRLSPCIWIMSISIRWHFWITVHGRSEENEILLLKNCSTFFHHLLFVAQKFIGWHVIKRISFVWILINGDSDFQLWKRLQKDWEKLKHSFSRTLEHSSEYKNVNWLQNRQNLIKAWIGAARKPRGPILPLS